MRRESTRPSIVLVALALALVAGAQAAANEARRVSLAQATGVETVRDTFTVRSYSNNDGTQPWASDWIEFGDDGRPDGGKIKIDKGRLQIKEDSRSIQRAVDLSAATSAVLTLDYQRKGEMEEEYVAVEVSTDGGTTWVELGRFTGEEEDNAVLPARYDLSVYRAAGTVIRLATSSDLGGEKLYVDNVQVEYTVGVLPTLTPAPTLTVPPTLTVQPSPTVDPTPTPRPVPTRDLAVRLHIPAVVHRWAWWYLQDAYEPNGSVVQAHGPLLSGQIYRAHIWNEQDENDYYTFAPATSTDAQLALSHIPPGCDYDLYVYQDDGTYSLVAYSNQAGNADEFITFSPTHGLRHYVRVHRYDGASSEEPYYLWVLYE
jgi:hypothetical protein